MSKREEWYGPLTRAAILIGLCSISWVVLGILAKLAKRLFNIGWNLV